MVDGGRGYHLGAAGGALSLLVGLLIAPAVLDRPFGAELRSWIQTLARRQRAVPAAAL